MKRQMFKSKIHRATVTGANVDYEGSITIDSELMRLADILPYEAVHVWNITNGARLMTYAIEGKAGSGEICVNGAGAKLCKVDDMIIIATFVELTDKRARKWNPLVINVNGKNKASANTGLLKAVEKKVSVIPAGNYLQNRIG
jgi:aspartate 1-decarboxylase